MHSIVTTFRGAVIKVEVANFCAAMDTLIDQDAVEYSISGSWSNGKRLYISLHWLLSFYVILINSNK